MPLLDGVYHEIPAQTFCKHCGGPTVAEYWRDFTIKGKFLVFAAPCYSCNAVNWHTAGKDKYVRRFFDQMAVASHLVQSGRFPFH